MIDINSILTQALAAAVAEATKPLVERIATLETRLLALENNPAQGVDTTLETRLLALEKHTAVLDQHGGILEYLDNQEWFWEKVSRYITNYSDITVDELHNIKQRLGDAEAAIKAHEDNAPHIGHLVIGQKIQEAIDEHNERTSHFDEDDIDTKIDNAIDNHEGNRTHGDEDDIGEIVKNLLREADIRIRF
jgi:phage shock protein A